MPGQLPITSLHHDTKHFRCLALHAPHFFSRTRDRREEEAAGAQRAVHRALDQLAEPVAGERVAGSSGQGRYCKGAQEGHDGGQW